MLVLDLDGTTLDAHGQLRPIDIAAAHALTEHGVHVTIATGRLFGGTQWVGRALGVKGGVAVMNGNEIIDVDSEVVAHGRYVSTESRAIARSVFADHDLSSPILFGSRRIHLAHREAHRRTYLSIWTHDLDLHDDIFESEAWSGANDIVAVGVAGPQETIEHARAAVHERLDDVVQTVVFRTSPDEFFLKLRRRGDDKGTALDHLATERDVSIERTVAVGDWLNDLPMLRRAGRSFAMAHADERVIEAATETLVTERASGGAVAEVAERVWGIRV